MQLKEIADSQQLLWTPPEIAKECLNGLSIAAEIVQCDLYRAVSAMLKSPIKAAVAQMKLASCGPCQPAGWPSSA